VVTIRGAVGDQVTDQPVPSATVEAQGKQAQTGSDGRYEIASLSPGDIIVTASKPGYEPNTITLTSTQPGQIYTHDFLLMPRADVQVFWTVPPDANMDHDYIMDVCAVAGPTWEGGTLILQLEEDPLFQPSPLTWPESYRDLEDTVTVQYYRYKTAAGGVLEPVHCDYHFGDLVPLDVPAHGKATAYFVVHHKWYWLPPWNWGRIVTTFAYMGLSKYAPWAPIPIFVVKQGSDALCSVEKITYRYAGFCGGAMQEIGPVLVRVPDNKFEELGLSYGLHLSASISTTFALMFGWCPAGWAAALTEGILIVAGEAQYVVASDPPDFNYTQVAPVIVPSLEELPSISDPNMRQACEDALLLAAISRAYRISIERYHGALVNGAFEWQNVQLAAAQHYLSGMQKHSDRMSAYWFVIAPTLPVPTPGDIEAAREYLRTHGLPDLEVSCLRAFGYDQVTIDDIAAATATLSDEYFMEPNRIAYGFATISDSLGQIMDGLPEVPSSVVSSTVALEPYVLNLKVDDVWTTCHIELPEGYDVRDINLPSVKLSATIPPEPSMYEFGDYDADGITELTVKFARALLVEALDTAQYGQDVLVPVTGQLNGGSKFMGIDTVVLANPCTDSLVFSGYEVVDQNRVNRTEFEYTFRLRARNNSPFDLKHTTIRLVAEPNNTAVLDDMVKFSLIKAGTETLSDDTFKVRIDRNFEGLVSDVVWKLCDCEIESGSDSETKTDLADLAEIADT